MLEQLPKMNTRVRFPSSAPYLSSANAVRLAHVGVTEWHNSVQTRSGVLQQGRIQRFCGGCGGDALA